MGVSGSGKSTVGKALAEALGCPFMDGDDLHPAANIAKMTAGQPLTDEDRAPWLAAVAGWIDAQLAAGEGGVVACSALKAVYRRVLVQGRAQVRLVFLDGSKALIAERLAHRAGHFMPPGLLDSQFETLERPGPSEDAIVIPIELPIAEQVQQVASKLMS